MPTYFPCPNTQCSYQFDADILPPAAMVTCPLCRTRFPYRANRPVTTEAGAPTADGAESRPSGPAVIKAREIPKSNVWVTTIAVGAFGLVLVAVLIGLMKQRGQPQNSSSSEATNESFNVKVDPFPGSWEEDFEYVRNPLEANILGRKRANPDGYVAVGARDWGDREPRTGELDEMMQGRLRSAFTSVIMEPVEGQTWANRPAISVRFTGSRNDEHVRGEAFTISNKGIGYLFVAWASEANWSGLQSELTSIREKIQPAGYRDKWMPKKMNVETFPSEDGKYQVEDVDGAWLKGKPADQWSPKEKKYVLEPEDLKGLDPNASMAFEAAYQFKERGDAKRHPATTHALVVELSKGGDPLEAAKAHVIERIKKDYAAANVPDIKLEPLNKGTALPTGGPAIGRFLFKDPFDKDNKVEWVISAISVGGKTVAVETSVLEKHATFVDEWMVHLAGSLKAR
jgi:hypothetical protein